ncbi:HlyC/CorC family transporter [Polyangium jinanense]|uniref:HlyC/CorC family transporter n=1 Tax=Polyangium jinanense TaxID=2829994 RepID=A0A9X4B0M0_9BACT|nr:HlyC/CorC family transporter [Polyangium jinanense]
MWDGSAPSKEAAIVTELLVILALVLVNGILAGAEIAVVALRGSRLDQLVAEKSTRARAVKALRDDPERFLATVQIGITVIGALAGAFGGATFAEDLAPLFRRVPILADHADAIALGLVVALISYLSLVLGELVPKSLALRYAETYALFIGRPLLGLAWLARPLVWFLTASSNVVLRLFGDKTTFTEARLSPDELQQLVGEAAKAGSLDPSAGEIAARALDLPELSAVQVMVPRTRVVSLPHDATLEDVRRVVAAHGHTRMPVYEGDLDHVIGYVNVKDVFIRATGDVSFRVKEVLRPPSFVGESMRAVSLLDAMKNRRTQIAIVVDELGATSGIVTLEDLVEELVGDVFSEHEAPAPELVRREPDGTFLVLGSAPVHDVNRELGLDLPVGDGYSTIAGLVLDLARSIPAAGTQLTAPDGTMIEVVEATPRHVKKVRIKPPAPPHEDR